MTVAAVALVVTLLTVPAVRTLMVRDGVLDQPTHRSSHLVATPRGGGVACVIGVVAGVVVAGVRGDEVPWALFACALALGALGYADDRYALAAVPRLAAQVLIGGVVGLTAAIAHAPLPVILLATLAGAFVVPAVVNGVNFMDGINGITSMTMTVWGVTTLLVGLGQRVPSLTVVGAVTVGSALGFLPWNAPRARMFLGDVGSYLFGGLVCAGLALGWAYGARLEILLAPLTLYAADTGITMLRRAARGASVTSAHREHAYQRLVNESGHSHLQVASSVALLAAGVTVVWAVAPTLVAAGVTALVCASYLLAPTFDRRPRAAVSHLGGVSA